MIMALFNLGNWTQVSTAWGIGLVVGPSIGGYLARVVSQCLFYFSLFNMKILILFTVMQQYSEVFLSLSLVCQPAQQYPNIFSDTSIFGRYRYILCT
jgi:hypothetical protein